MKYLLIRAKGPLYGSPFLRAPPNEEKHGLRSRIKRWTRGDWNKIDPEKGPPFKRCLLESLDATQDWFWSEIGGFDLKRFIY